MTFRITQAQYNTLKKRWKNVRTKSPEVLDEGSHEILDAFNSIPGLVTVWSCVGHTEDEDQPHYILCALTAEAVKTIENIFESLIIAVKKRWDEPEFDYHHFELLLNFLHWGFDNIHEQEGKPYPVYILRYRGRLRNYLKFNEYLLKAIKEWQ